MRSNSVLKAPNKNSQQYNTENFKLLSLFYASCKMVNTIDTTKYTTYYNKHQPAYFFDCENQKSNPTTYNHTLVPNEKVCLVKLPVNFACLELMM